MDPQEPRTPFQKEPRPGPSTGFATGLGIVLAISLLLNGVLGVRATQDRERASTLQAQLDQQERELAALRERIRGSGKGDPLGRIASAVEQLRKLDFKRKVQPELLSAAGLAARVRAAFTKEADKADIEASGRVLAMLGVLPEDMDLYKTLLALQAEQVAGFYDNRTKKMVAAASDAQNPSPLARIFLAHEYVHALTDQYFSLGRIDDLQEAGKDDESSAFQALIEGDATAIMGVYQAEVLTADEQTKAGQELAGISQSRFDAAPRFLQDELQFPYLQGVSFVRALQESGGEDAVDNAYREPPTSTEQILHPAKYLSTVRDEPTSVRLPNVKRALGGGWATLQTGGLGEFDLREILDLAGGTGLNATDAREAAAGWDGGRYVALRSGSETVVALSTVWDSASQATEADRAFGRWLPLRYRNVGRAFSPKNSGNGWSTDHGAGLVARSGKRVLLVLGPDRSTIEKARTAFGY